MGHKVHPVGFRVGVIRGWDAKWYADKHFVAYLQEDLKVRKAILSMYPEAGVSKVEIDRQANNVTLTIHTARPGILIGRGGQRVDEMRKKLQDLIGKRIQLNIREIQQPELDAYLVARNIAEQMERRISYRRAMKQSLQRTILAGAKGMRVRCAGRLDGAEIARKIIMHEGRVPLHTIRADVDYGLTEARTVMGRIGVKVWIYKGDILPEIGEAEPAPATGQTVLEPGIEAKLAEAAAAVATEAAVEAGKAKPAAEAPAEEKPAPAKRAPRARKAVAEPAAEEVKPEEVKPEASAAEEKPKAVRKPRAAKAVAPAATEETNAKEETPKPRTRKARPASGSDKTGDSDATA